MLHEECQCFACSQVKDSMSFDLHARHGSVVRAEPDMITHSSSCVFCACERLWCDLFMISPTARPAMQQIHATQLHSREHQHSTHHSHMYRSSSDCLSSILFCNRLVFSGCCPGCCCILSSGRSGLPQQVLQSGIKLDQTNIKR